MRLAVCNLKGGTAKTTTAVFLAAGLQRDGRTLLVDADPQASALTWAELVDDFPVTTVGLAKPVLHRQLPELGRGFEHVVMDCPPADEAIVRSALMVADLVLVPMAPSMMDLQRLRPTLELLADVAPIHEPLLRALLTRVRRGTQMSTAARGWLGDLSVPVLVAEIPLRETYTRALGEAPRMGTEYDAVLTELTQVSASAGEQERT